MKKFHIILILLLSIESFGQNEFRRRKIQLDPIDTSEVFIYETKNALLYFSQKDLIEYLDKIDSNSQDIYKDFIDTLKLNTRTIHIKSDTIYDKVYEFNRGNGLIEKGEFPSGKDKRDYLSKTFMFIASDLLTLGKVKPYIKSKNKFQLDFIIAKKRIGYLGSEYLVFYASDKTQIYEVITALGE